MNIKFLAKITRNFLIGLFSVILVTSVNLSSCLNSALAQDSESSVSTVPSPLISIEIFTSREEVSAGAGLGISAKATNNSNTDIYLRESDFTVTLPTELESQFKSQTGYTSLFPTEPDYADFWDESQPGQNRVDTDIIKLSPGDSYTSFWSPLESSTFNSPLEYNISLLVTELYHIFFQPGEYTITINTKYWTSPELPDNGYRTTTKLERINVSAPQSIILVGAAIGGICSYALKRLSAPEEKMSPSNTEAKQTEELRKGKSVQKAFYTFSSALSVSFDILGAILLSGIVTILLSRIADNTFLISVEVRDFWGAIAIGFVANYIGVSLLKRIIGHENKAPSNELPSEKTQKSV